MPFAQLNIDLQILHHELKHRPQIQELHDVEQVLIAHLLHKMHSGKHA